MRARRSAWLTVPALLLPLLLVPGVRAASATGPTGVALSDLLDVPSTAALRTAGLLDADVTTAWPARASGQRAAYYDTCHDVVQGAVDLRRLDLSEDTPTRTYDLTVTTCGPLSPATLGEGSVMLAVAVPGGRDDGFDYVLTLFSTGTALQLEVDRTPSDDPSTWRREYSGAVTQPDARSASASVPTFALGRPSEIAFGVVAQSADSSQDLLPEAYAAPLSYPYACNVAPAGAATVVAAPGRAGTVVAAARGRGAQVEGSSTSVVRLRDVSDADLAALQRTPGVRTATRPVRFAKLATANDPAFPEQWALGAIGAPSGWEVRRSSGLVLAVVDDGVDGVRAELAGRVRPGRDTLFDVPLPVDSDLGGHGTAVAGLATATTDNGVGIAGVDWGAEVLPIRVFDASGCADDAAVADAMYLAADAGASVVNLSLGGPTDAPAVHQAVKDVTARGVLVVAASGNARAVGNEVSYPAAYDEVVAVGATTRTGALAPYSSSGPHLDLTAPGGDGRATPASDLIVLGEGDTLATQAGTSFATPLVSASALLFRAQYPTVGPRATAAALRRSATDAGPVGPDPDFGAGRLDLASLLRLPVAVARGTDLGCPPGQVPEDGLADADGSVHEANVDCIVWWQVAASATRRYDPGAVVTRAQMASFLARVITRSGGSLPADPPDAFSDDLGSVHEHSIDQLAAVGVLAGTNGRALPAASVTRAQMATFLVRAYELRAVRALPDGPDYFLDDDASVHAQAIGRAAAAGLTGGLASGDFGPGLPVRRDAMGSFLARVLDRLVEDGLTTPPGA
jgi:hypothetical protein